MSLEAILAVKMSTPAFEVKPINSQAGLYFEEVGRIRLYHEDWKLVTYLNLTVYQEEYGHLRNMVGKMIGVCGELVERPINAPGLDISCGPILEQIKILVIEMDEYNVKWFLGRGRNKRALLNIIGSVSKALFGTLDESDAEKYLNEFKNLHARNELRDRINEEHTSLIQSLTNLMGEGEEIRKNQTMMLARQIDIVRESVDSIRENYIPTVIMKLKTQIQDMTAYVTLLIMSYQNKQRQFLESVSVGQKSPNSPSLIPPQMFLEELINIRREVTARDLDFPLEPKTDTLATFYTISSPEARIVQNQLIISFTLPLVTTTEYLLYKVSSLPYRIRGNLFGYVVPTHEFVALDSFKEKYVPIAAEELDNCYHINGRKLACKQTTPIMAAFSTKNCEINMLRMSNATEMCDERVSNLTSELWIKLRQTNTYIYTFPKEENVYVKCPRILETRILKGTGVISIEPNCQIKTDNVIIRGFKTTETERMREIIPAARLGTDMNETLNKALQLEEFHIENIVTPNIINLGQKNKLQSISMGIDRVRFLESELRNQWSPEKNRRDIWKITAGMLIVVLIIGVLGVWLTVKKMKKFNKTKKLKKNRIHNNETNTSTHVSGTLVDQIIVEETEEEIELEKNEKPEEFKRKGYKWHP